MVVMYYHKWKQEILEKQDRFYRKAAIVLAILGLLSAGVAFWGIISNI
jgi:hypothetical protein